MPGIDGIEATRRDHRARQTRRPRGGPYDFDRYEYVYDALRAGASGFLLKDAPTAQLRRGVRVVARGEALLAPSVTRRLIEEFTRAAGTPRRPGLRRSSPRASSRS